LRYGSILIKAVEGLYGWVMNLSGIKGLASMAVILLLVAGCSTPAPESKPEYDQLEVLKYGKCIDVFIKKDNWDPGYPDELTKVKLVYAFEACEQYKPRKQG